MTPIAIDAARPTVEIARGNPAPPLRAHFEGPFGRLHGTIDAARTWIEGGPFGSAEVAWGATSDADRSQIAKLQGPGILLRIGTQTGVVVQPQMGLTRRTRAVHVGIGDRRWTWRQQRISRHRLEREDGTIVAEWPTKVFGRGLAVDDAADPLEVLVCATTWCAGLDLRCHGASISW